MVADARVTELRTRAMHACAGLTACGNCVDGDFFDVAGSGSELDWTVQSEDCTAPVTAPVSAPGTLPDFPSATNSAMAAESGEPARAAATAEKSDNVPVGGDVGVAARSPDYGCTYA